MDKPQLTCRLCNQPVEHNKEYYDVFEGMHWICFHIMFEHSGDPDVPCADPICPWNQINLYKSKLEALGVDVDKLVASSFAVPE